MIDLQINTGNSSKEIARLLHGIPGDSRTILKNALNAAARQSLKMLKEDTKKKYDVKAAAFKKGKDGSNIQIKGAKKNNLDAVIMISSRKLELVKFKYSPLKQPDPKSLPEFIRGRVLKTGSMKKLAKFGNKAFLVKYKSGHLTIAARESSSRMPIKTLYSPAVTQLIGSYKVYGKLKPQMHQIMADELKKQADKTLSKYAGGRK